LRTSRIASEMLASVILPRPESDLKTELNFPVNDSNTAFPQTSLLPGRFNPKNILAKWGL
jgi:hypothetical protein